MKIALLTLTHNSNFGATMQCYALSKFLSEQRHEVVLINVHESFFDSYLRNNVVPNKRNLGLHIKKFLAKYFGIGEQPPIVYSWHNKIYSMIEEEKKKFAEFENKQLPPFSEVYNSFEDFTEKGYPKADLYIVGSDQVWNKKITQTNTCVYFFSFLKEEPRLSYAASLGGSANTLFTSEEIEEIKGLLHKFNSISVREEVGKTILNNVFNSDGEIVLDPTLLLDVKFYNELASLSSIEDKQFLFHYKFKINPEWWRAAELIANTLHLKHRADWQKHHIKNMNYNPVIGVTDWLKLIKTADFVMTDSYHGMLFSIIFRKQFIVVSTDENSRGRMLRILTSIGLEDRLYGSYDEIELNYKRWMNVIDYDSVTEKLFPIQEQSKKFLIESINKVKNQISVK